MDTHFVIVRVRQYGDYMDVPLCSTSWGEGPRNKTNHYLHTSRPVQALSPVSGLGTSTACARCYFLHGGREGGGGVLACSGLCTADI